MIRKRPLYKPLLQTLMGVGPERSQWPLSHSPGPSRKLSKMERHSPSNREQGSAHGLGPQPQAAGWSGCPKMPVVSAAPPFHDSLP